MRADSKDTKLQKKIDKMRALNRTPILPNKKLILVHQHKRFPEPKHVMAYCKTALLKK
jgi:hypothetical protein